MSYITIVAEIGCNHNGDVSLAKKMIYEAKNCGVNAVKFQTFRANELISKYAPKAEYQKKTTGEEDSQLEMTQKLELSHDDYMELKSQAEELGLVVFSTPFDLESIHFLKTMGQEIWKIPSGEITNLPYLREIGSIRCKNKKVILSTGMAEIGEIQNAVDILCDYGMDKKELTLLHCNTEYPTPDEDVNILAINDLRNHFPDISVGFSDHSVGYVAAVGAAVLGISMIEKHFTLDKNLPGPDHQASATPDELKQLVDNVRRIENMVGSEHKKVTESEKKNRIVARKSIVALRDIKKGETLTINNITCKRPGNGISPMFWDEIIGKKVDDDFIEDQLIKIKGYSWQE